MTLVIALNCKNGIVMASDGQATINSTGGPVRAPIQKIFKINNHVLFGASGNVGTIQRSLAVVEALSPKLEREWNYGLMEEVRKTLFEVYKNEIDRHRAFYKGTPYENIHNAPISDVLLCSLTQKQKMLWHIAPDCSDELLQDMGYACTGSGDVFAYTLLKNFNIKSNNIAEGKLIAYRVIKEAIKIGAYGLGEPIDIWVIQHKNGKIVIEQLNQEEIIALGDSHLTWRTMEREVFKKIYEKK
jgi:20S proteasome, alpha and beta subunits